MVKELGQATGESLTVAVREAIRERLERVRSVPKKELPEPLLQIGKECAARLNEPCKSIDHGQLLYDGKGLPK
jgi:antitoxin VapB